MARLEDIYIVPNPALVPTPMAVTDLEVNRREDETGMVVDRRIQKALMQTAGAGSVPLSGIFMVCGGEEEFDQAVKDLDDALRNLARASFDPRKEAAEEPTLFDGPVDVDLVRLDAVSEFLQDDGEDPIPAAVWFLTPSPTDPFVDPALYPSPDDLSRLTSSRFVALLPRSSDWEGPHIGSADALCVDLAPWSKLYMELAEELRTGVAEKGESIQVPNDSTAESFEELQDSVDSLRLAEIDSRDSDGDLRIVYRRGRDLSHKASLMRHWGQMRQDEVRLSSLIPIVGEPSPMGWIAACRKPMDDCSERMELARRELSQLSTQATQVFTYLNLAQSSRTQTIVEVVGIVVFMLGILGVYFSAVTGTPKVPDFEGDGAQFTVFSLVGIAIYSSLLYWWAKKCRPNWKPSASQRQMLLTVGLALGVAGVVTSAILENGIPGLIALPAAILIAAPAMARR